MNCFFFFLFFRNKKIARTTKILKKNKLLLIKLRWCLFWFPLGISAEFTYGIVMDGSPRVALSWATDKKKSNKKKIRIRKKSENRLIYFQI